jgi:tetratricopeptide (TPR) repeat protein
MFLLEEGQVPKEVKKLLDNLSTHITLGKVIILTNQVIQRGNWCDQIVFKTFPGFLNSEAVECFDNLLKERNVSIDIEYSRKEDIVKALGKNPRAMNIFVQCLSWGTLEELIGELPEDWESKDRDFSEQLLFKLEETLIKKNLGRFEDKELKILENVSVLRKPFQKEAIEKMSITPQEALSFREKYSQYYFLEKNNDWFNLHPVLKEVCKLKLSTNNNLFKTAHRMAAEYYTRHFYSRELKNIGKLGGFFVEARYHLSMSESTEKLEEVFHNFEKFILSTITPSSPIPKDTQPLNERITLLTAYLGKGGPKGLEFHLAKCLEIRGQKNDLEKALRHSGKALGQNTPVEAWLLNIRLNVVINGLQSGIEKAKKAIEITVSNDSRSLYQACAELMEKNGQIDEAIKLLKDGISKVSVSNNSFSLYIACAELMEKNNQFDEAIELLENGISKVTPSNGSFSLYIACAELMEKNNQIDAAIILLENGISKIPASYGSASLYQACAELMEKNNQVDEAIKLLENGISKIPTSYGGYRLSEQGVLYACRTKNISKLISFSANAKGKDQSLFAQILKHYAEGNFDISTEYLGKEEFSEKYIAGKIQLMFGLLCEKKYSEADTFLSKIELREEQKGNVWLMTLSAIRSNDFEKANELFALLRNNLPNSYQVTEKDLIKYWWESRNEKFCPSYNFPHLPAKLTGYHKELSIASKTIEKDIHTFLNSDESKPELNTKTKYNILCIATEWFSKNGGLK